MQLSGLHGFSRAFCHVYIGCKIGVDDRVFSFWRSSCVATNMKHVPQPCKNTSPTFAHPQFCCCHRPLRCTFDSIAMSSPYSSLQSSDKDVDQRFACAPLLDSYKLFEVIYST